MRKYFSRLIYYLQFKQQFTSEELLSYQRLWRHNHRGSPPRRSCAAWRWRRTNSAPPSSPPPISPPSSSLLPTRTSVVTSLMACLGGGRAGCGHHRRSSASWRGASLKVCCHWRFGDASCAPPRCWNDGGACCHGYCVKIGLYLKIKICWVFFYITVLYLHNLLARKFKFLKKRWKYHFTLEQGSANCGPRATFRISLQLI